MPRYSNSVPDKIVRPPVREYKLCKGCNQTLPREAFYPVPSRRPDGLSQMCRLNGCESKRVLAQQAKRRAHERVLRAAGFTPNVRPAPI